MTKININLLPPGLAQERKDVAKKTLIIRISVGILLLVIILAVSIFTFSLFLNQDLRAASKETENKRNKITSLKDIEGLASTLKNRLDIISKVSEKESYQAQMFNLISTFVPGDLKITSFTQAKENTINLSGETSNTKSMELFFNNLTDPKTNEGKVASVKVDSLNRNPNSLIRFDLTVTLNSF